MKLGICIPYRDRKNHLERLMPHLSNHLKSQGIEHKFYVGHQNDENLFNRGMMKNIAAKYAIEEGCDYVAFHDVDMLPYEESDYSYPNQNPIHIATKLSKYHYGLGYDQYFGGVVLFSKEHLEKTNGYSNEYWDWGQEDDDLFWRCYYEGYTTGNLLKKYENKTVANFNGKDSFLKIPTNREISLSLRGNHTISILFSAEQQPEKVPIWLVGDTNKKFIEYPIIRKDGSGTWGISFNNSRAVTMMLFDKMNKPYYNWAKRFENLWTWVTLSVSQETGEAFFYLNNELICQMNGIKDNKPFPIDSNLRSHDSIRPFLLGFCSDMNTHFKGKIAEVKVYNKFYKDIDECDDIDLIINYNFNEHTNLDFENSNVTFNNENIQVIENIVPFRRESRFYCLPHTDEGFVNGKWAKGETTARNEKRFVTEMQQGKVNYKNDGINSLNYELINTEMFSDNCLMINVKTK